MNPQESHTTLDHLLSLRHMSDSVSCASHRDSCKAYGHKLQKLSQAKRFTASEGDRHSDTGGLEACLRREHEEEGGPQGQVGQQRKHLGPSAEEGQ